MSLHPLGLANKPPFNYSLSGTVLSQVHNVSDLGVLFDSKLNFSAHCNKTAAKGFSRATLLLKCFYSNDRTLQCKLLQRLSGLCLSTTLQFCLPTSQKTFLHLKKYKNTLPKTLKVLKTNLIKNALQFSIFLLWSVAEPTMT